MHLFNITNFLSSTGDPVLLMGFIVFILLLLALPISFWSLASNSSIPFARFLVALANLFLAFQLSIRWIQSGHFPISNLYESLCFLTWSTTFVQLIIEKSWPSPIISALFTPFSLLTISFASFVLPDQLQIAAPLVPALKSSWLVMHVSVIMCSYAALLLGSLLSLGVLITDRSKEFQIRSSSYGVGSFRTNYQLDTSENSQSIVTPISFTNAENLDNLSYRTITVGFLLLTFGLISGAVWANEAWGSWWSWDPKETWALISWLVYAAYLHSRITRGWQGRKPALIALSGLFVIVVCYLGVNLLGIGLHSYGWFF